MRPRLKYILRVFAGTVCLICMLVTLIGHPNMFKDPQTIFPMDVEERTTTQQDRSDFPSIDWERWEDLNPDIIGWLTVPGTSIDQPIVQAQASNDSFYLDHDIYGRSNEEGCAFLDAKCDRLGLLSRNSLIFGHHLTRNRGFSPFAGFVEKGYAEKHERILLQTQSWQKALKVVAVEVTRGDAPTKVTSFESDEQFIMWLEKRYEESTVKLGDQPAALSPERVWTFCTCSYSTYADERTLVYAIEDAEA